MGSENIIIMTILSLCEGIRVTMVSLECNNVRLTVLQTLLISLFP